MLTLWGSMMCKDVIYCMLFCPACRYTHTTSNPSKIVERFASDMKVINTEKECSKDTTVIGRLPLVKLSQ